MTTQVGALPGAIVVQGLHESAPIQSAAQIAGGVRAYGQARGVGIFDGAISRRP